MTKASHNTFSYCSPMQWYLKPFAFIAKCQSKPLYQQVREGIKVFDLRIRKDRDEQLVIAHNAFIYEKGELNILNILEWLDSESKYSDERIYVRVLHEIRNDRQLMYDDGSFVDFCSKITKKFTNLVFFGGQRTMDWQQEYTFPADLFGEKVEYIEKHESVRWPKWLHWWPWLYAKLYNKTNIELYKDKDIIMFYDFV